MNIGAEDGTRVDVQVEKISKSENYISGRYIVLVDFSVSWIVNNGNRLAAVEFFQCG
jgi:hypothetical protein